MPALIKSAMALKKIVLFIILIIWFKLYTSQMYIREDEQLMNFTKIQENNQGNFKKF